jgi:hypothetical protein
MTSRWRKTRWFIWREVTVITRIGGFWTGMVTYVLILGAFVLTWSDGVPTLGGTFSDQMMSLQTALLCMLLPWTAVRCFGIDEMRGLVVLALMTGSRASSVIAAKAVGVCAALTAIVISGGPYAILAQQISARPASVVALEMLRLIALAMVVAALSTAGVLISLNRLGLWLLTTAATAAAVYIVPNNRLSTIVFLGIGLVGAVMLSSRASGSSRYLPDHAASGRV